MRASRVFRASRNIALYRAFDGEIDVSPLLGDALARGKRVYLPVLSGGAAPSLRFARYHPGMSTRNNRYGITEPAPGQWELLDPRRLDLVITPLVGFDRHGNRLGMGGGYYDRCFAFLKTRRLWRRPRLLGVGYELQRLTTIQPQRWDVRLWAVATEAAFYGE